jgi:hypothetical protein
MAGETGKIDKSKYYDEWILVCKGKVVKHSKKMEDLLGIAEHKNHTEDCYIEKVLDGQVCFY